MIEKGTEYVIKNPYTPFEQGAIVTFLGDVRKETVETPWGNVLNQQSWDTPKWMVVTGKSFDSKHNMAAAISYSDVKPRYDNIHEGFMRYNEFKTQVGFKALAWLRATDKCVGDAGIENVLHIHFADAENFTITLKVSGVKEPLKVDMTMTQARLSESTWDDRMFELWKNHRAETKSQKQQKVIDNLINDLVKICKLPENLHVEVAPSLVKLSVKINDQQLPESTVIVEVIDGYENYVPKMNYQHLNWHDETSESTVGAIKIMAAMHSDWERAARICYHACTMYRKSL